MLELPCSLRRNAAWNPRIRRIPGKSVSGVTRRTAKRISYFSLRTAEDSCWERFAGACNEPEARLIEIIGIAGSHPLVDSCGGYYGNCVVLDSSTLQPGYCLCK